MKNKKSHLLRNVLIAVISILAVLILTITIYVNTYYHSLNYAKECISSPDNNVSISTLENDGLIFSPVNNDLHIGIIFYPGGKVEYDAYSPLLSLLAGKGITCVLLRMPCNLAFLNIDAANGITDSFPNIDTWYLAGHSLGGVAAAVYLGENYEKYDGLILLASYSSTDLSNTNLNTLLIYGSNDLVINKENYTKCLANLPSDYMEVVIDGGCHSYFGSYGEQKGDGIPVITDIQQQNQTVEAIMKYITK